jgi:hypothetical protein
MGVVPFVSVGVTRFLRHSGLCPLMLRPSSGVSGRIVGAVVVGILGVVAVVVSKVFISSTCVLSLVFLVVSVEEHPLGLGGRGGPGLWSRRHSVSESGCIIQAIWQIVYSSSSSVMPSWKVSGKFVLTRLIFALLFAVANADAFFFALSGAFYLYAISDGPMLRFGRHCRRYSGLKFCRPHIVLRSCT